MSKPVVYLDLDRTLFRTSEVGQIWQYIEHIHPDSIDAAKEHQRRNEFYRRSNDMYCHDVSAQLRSLGLEPSAIYDSAARSPLADGRFEHEGCNSLVEYVRHVAQPIVLTYGTDDYQRLKAALCPSLRGLPVETTLQPKTDWLQDHAAAGWLVDDKPLGALIPEGIRFIQVRHGQSHSTDQSWPVYASLAEVEQYFRQAIPDKGTTRHS